MTDDMDPATTETFWEEFYRKQERVWSGNPNAILVREVTGLDPGTALDLGCGEGADAIWLAQHGWRVTCKRRLRSRPGAGVKVDHLRRCLC